MEYKKKLALKTVYNDLIQKAINKQPIDPDKTLEDLEIAKTELNFLNKALKKGETFTNGSRIVSLSFEELKSLLEDLAKGCNISGGEELAEKMDCGYKDILDNFNTDIPYFLKSDKLPIKGRLNYGELVDMLNTRFEEFYKIYSKALRDVTGIK